METEERLNETMSVPNEVYRLPAWTMLLGATVAILGIVGLFVPWFSVSGSSSFQGQVQARSSISAMGYDVTTAWVALVFGILTAALIIVGCLLRSLNKTTAMTLSGILAGFCLIMLITAISALTYMGSLGASYSVSSDFGGASVRGSAGWTVFIFLPLAAFMSAGIACGMWFKACFNPVQIARLESVRQGPNASLHLSTASTEERATPSPPKADRRPLFRKIAGITLVVLGGIGMLGFIGALFPDGSVIQFLLFFLWGVSGLIIFDFGILLASQYQLSYVVRRVYSLTVKYSVIAECSSDAASRFPSGIGWVFLLALSLPLWFLSILIFFIAMSDGAFVGMVLGAVLAAVSVILADLVIYSATNTGMIIPRLKKMGER